jgi:DNA topoisomerase-1
MAPEDLKATGLVYVSDSEPGIRRQRAGRSFCYRLPDGSLVRDAALKARIAALGLPPAYENVWICLEENGHLQATGYDARGRKQYRYHPDWQALKSGDKFDQLIAFGRALPKLRRAVRRDLDGAPGTVDTMLAAITVLLDEAQLRVGNRAYAVENKTYGATTLLKRHVSLGDGRIELRFAAKGGKRVRRTLRHPRLQRLLEGGPGAADRFRPPQHLSRRYLRHCGLRQDLPHLGRQPCRVFHGAPGDRGGRAPDD